MSEWVRNTANSGPLECQRAYICAVLSKNYLHYDLLLLKSV